MPSSSVRVKVRIEIGARHIEIEELVADPSLNGWQATPDHIVDSAIKQMVGKARGAILPLRLTDD